MEVNNSLVSLQLERTFLGGLINHQDMFADVDNMISNNDFSNKVHSTIYTILKQSLLNKEKIDKVLIAQKIKNLGVSFQDNLDIFDYVEDLVFTKINAKSLKEVAMELVALRIRRELCEHSEEEKRFVIENPEKDINEVVAEVDKIHNSKIISYTTNTEPQDLYAGIEEFIKNIAKNPLKECGLITPFDQFNKFFGGLKSGDGAYFFCGRAGEGKSALLFNFAKGVALLNQCPILYIDTEMSQDLNMFRAAAAEANVNAWFLQTGNWIKKRDMAIKIEESFKEIKKYTGLFFHKYAPNKDINEVASIIKKWIYKRVGRGNKCLVVYDYLKITTDVDKDRSEWQQLGDKISILNEIGNHLNIPILCAGQQNRTGEQNGVRLDDSTTVAGSDRINMYARFNAVFRRKSLEEISEHGTQFGTHLLKPIKWSRDQGEEDFNIHSYIKTIDHHGHTKYKQNFINFIIQNYNIKDNGTLEEIVKFRQLHQNLQGGTVKHNDGSLEF